MIKSKNIFFVGNARDYHAVDWYRTAKRIDAANKYFFVTDLIDSEGHEKLIRRDDDIIELFNIDWILFPHQSRFGNVWRNFVKLAFSPIQVMRLKALARANPDSVFHAHTIYYMFLCWLSRISYIGTPQGSEILVRPFKSKAYKYFAIKSLSAAKQVTVDSVNMQKRIIELCGRESVLIQNGIDVTAALCMHERSDKRENVVSIRGLTPLYRINEIFEGRMRSSEKPALILIYPFWEDTYKAKVHERLVDGDRNLGRLPRLEMYKLLASTMLVISIPKSDSSPRSVYEAIFCGCCVAVTYNTWIEQLPKCMRSRLFIVDLTDSSWFEKAINYSRMITEEVYKPSDAALEMFDQRRSLKKVVKLFY